MIVLCPLSDVRRATCVVSRQLFTLYSLEATFFGPIIMKLGQNVCLDEISDDVENGSCRVNN